MKERRNLRLIRQVERELLPLGRGTVEKTKLMRTARLRKKVRHGNDGRLPATVDIRQRVSIRNRFEAAPVAESRIDWRYRWGGGKPGTDTLRIFDQLEESDHRRSPSLLRATDAHRR